ncbi:hypothetical protein Tco_0701194 [Tanacetum coccineum]
MGSGEGGDNHKKKTDGKVGDTQLAQIDDNLAFPKLNNLVDWCWGCWGNNDELNANVGINMMVDAARNKNGCGKDGNAHVNEFPSSYATKLSPASLTKDNLQKLEANVPKDVDYYVWLYLASVHEVNDIMKNLLHGYFIGKRLAFPFSSIKGVDSVLRDGPWMIRGIPIFLNKYDNLVMAIPNLEEIGYTKETIRVEYEWEPPRCSETPEADYEGFIKVKKKKSGGNNGGYKNFKPVSVIPKTLYRPKAKQSTEGASPKTTPSVVETGNKASTSGVQEEGQSSTPLVEKINMFVQQLLEGKCVLVDDDGKPLEKVDYSGDHDSEDEVEPIDNEIASFLASKPSGVGYGTNSLLEQ